MSLRKIRIHRGLSQRDLAALVGVDASTIQRAEVQASTAKLDTYRRCAEALGVSLAEIFAENWDPEEAEFLRLLRALPASKRQHVAAVLELVRPEAP